MPVAEALSVGTPVICSDLPALREMGGDTPDYLNPTWGEHMAIVTRAIEKLQR